MQLAFPIPGIGDALMITIINSKSVAKIAVFLFAIFCDAALHYGKAVAQISVEVNNNFSDAGNRPLSQKLFNINPDDVDADVSGNRIYYRNCSDVGKLYTINTDGSGRQKLSDD